ncbi:MAG: hypothetical protein QOK42_2039 [Frankiaceae bacterium]|nr:hypothetical protein [Frankiaceae bacterium]
MRHFSFAPALTMSGRKKKGLRGLAGKPFHPPLTDVPVGTYTAAVVFDVLSAVLYGGHEQLSTELYRAATWTLLVGAAVSLLAALTGWADWHRSSEPGTQARRTINAHAVLMLTTTALILLDIALRITTYKDDEKTPVVVLVLTILAFLIMSVGSSIGGSVVYDYGFNVETAGDHPVWHKSETDVLPGEKAPTS